MQKTDSTQRAASIRRKVKGSTTLNRKYVKRPTQDNDAMVYASRSPKISRFGKMDAETQQMPANNIKLQPLMNASQPIEAQVQPHPMQVAANVKMHSRRITVESGDSRPKLSAKQLKDQAIQKALATTTVSSAQEEKRANTRTKSTLPISLPLVLEGFYSHLAVQQLRYLLLFTL